MRSRARPLHPIGRNSPDHLERSVHRFFNLRLQAQMVWERDYLFACFTGFWSIVLFGYIRKGDIAKGMNYVFFKYYDWPSFVIPIIASTLGIGLWAAAENAIRKFLNRPLPALPALAVHSADDGQTNPAIPGPDHRVCVEDKTRVVLADITDMVPLST
jgi:hypothetical protein